MLNSLLSIDAHGDGNYYFSNFGEAFIYALIGFLVVVIGIVLIIFIIWLIGLILRKTNNLAFLSKFKAKCKGALSKRKKKPEEAEKQEKTEAVTADGEDISDEVKVAIIAAIMAYYSEEKPQCEFKVKRIRRI
ncbi:MAG: OadG family protein [Clostridia bacterium]|nr:OadG family protein [Clostridia bacterium]